MAIVYSPGVLSAQGSELEADTLATLAAETSSAGGDRILDADEVAAELVFDAPPPAAPAAGKSARPGPPPLAAKPRGARPVTSPPPVRTRPPPTAAALGARLESTEAELTRLRAQMRARDAYLVELERALEASTSKLEASGIGSIEDAHRLLGRVRGQAFRIAELESELRNMEARLSRLARLLPAGYTA